MAVCLKPHEVEAFVAGELSAEEQNCFEAHVGSCAYCRKAINDSKRDRELARGIQQAYKTAAVSESDSTFALSTDWRPDKAVSIDGYEILHEIHRGGQGVVYKAVQVATKRTVALKVLLHGPYASAKQQHRFEREIDLVASLQHPNIVTVYDSGLAHGRHYYAMEYIHGQPLDSYLSRAKLSIDETLRLFQKICLAVNAAHQRGVIHRDLKPGNIRVDSEGEPHVLDFGLAKTAGPNLQDGVPVTISGEFMGTLAYASPEQIKGDPKAVDIRTDVYSLGVILFEMLTGQHPYRVVGHMAEVLDNIARTEPKRPSTIRRQINDEVETIVLQALAKEKERRYQSAEALGRDIGRYLAGEVIEAKRNSAFYVLRKSVARHRRWVAAGIMLFLLVTVCGIVSFGQAQKNRRLASRERAARGLADTTADRLAAELVANRIERGRQFSRAGNLATAEDLIWREHLKDPTSTHSYWALWELYSQNPSLATFVGHERALREMSIAADGRTLATAGRDGAIRIWSAESFEPLGQLEGHSAAVSALAHSSDGRWIASGSYDGTVKVWDAARHELVHTLRGHDGRLAAVDFAANGERVLSGGADGDVRVWDTDTGTCVRVIEEFQAPVSALRYNHDARTLAVAWSNGTIKLWEGVFDSLVATLTVNEPITTDLALSPDAHLLACGGRASRVSSIWRLGDLSIRETLGQPDNGTLRFLAFGPQGQTLLIGGWHRVDEWNLSTRRCRTLIGLGVHGDGAVSPDGNVVVTGSSGGSIRVTDRRTDVGEIHLGGRSNVGVASISPDGRIIACGDDTDHVRLWEIATGRMLAKLPSATGRWSSAHFHPSGKILATCGVDGVVHLWDLETGRSLRTIKDIHVTSSQTLSFNPDGRTLATTMKDWTIQVRDVQTGSVLATLPSAGSEALAVRFSPDGRTIATTHRNNRVSLWTARGEPLGTLDIGFAPWTVGFRPDSRKLAVGCWDHQFQIWDIATRALDGQLGATKVVSWGATYKPTDSNVLATCSGNGAVQLWDLREQRNILTLEPFGESDALCVAFTPDGMTLVASGFDGTLCAWDLEYYDRHIVGNLEYQIGRLREELGDDLQTEHVRAWAEEVRRRPWPRIGPHARNVEASHEPSHSRRGVAPKVIAAWGQSAQADG